MDLSGLIRAVFTSKEGLSRDLLTGLQPGHRLTGRVLKVESDGRVLIDLGRFQALGRISFGVKPGQTLQLQVVEGGPELHLKLVTPNLFNQQMGLPQLNLDQILDKAGQQRFSYIADVLTGRTQPTQTLDLLPGTAQNVTERPEQQRIIEKSNNHASQARSAIVSEPLPEKVQKALLQIKTFFDPLPVDRPPQKLALWLRSALEDRGLLFEKRLADAVIKSEETDYQLKTAYAPQVKAVIARDLKANLMVLKAFFDGEPALSPELLTRKITKDIEFLRKSVSRLLGHVEQQQQRVGARQGDGTSFQIFAHMLPVQDQTMPVQIKIYYPEKGRPAKRDPLHRVALLLDMDNLGAVRVDLMMMEKELRIHFFVRDDAVRDRFEKHTETVAAALAESFSQIRISTVVSQEKIRRFYDEEKGGTPTGRIDIQV